MFFAQPTAPSPELNRRQRRSVILMDIALLAEVTLSIYTASKYPDDFTPVFMKVFFSMLIPTVIAGVYAIRHFRDRSDGAEA